MAKKKTDWISKEVVIKEWGGGKFTVSATKPYQREDNDGVLEVTLHKHWWGKDMSQRSFQSGSSFYNKRNFTIKNLDDYEAVRDAIENELAESLRWDIKDKVKKLKKDSKHTKEIREIVETSPKTGLDFIREVSNYIKKAKEEDADLSFLKELSQLLAEVSKQVNKRIFDSLRELIPKLAKEEKHDLEQFNKLIDEYGLKDINLLTQRIMQKLDAIDLFDDLVTDDKTKEMGTSKLNSMHHFLEENMWLLDEKYEWFLSNRQIKTLIKKDIEKTDKKHEKKRPDFALAHDDTKTLIIAEIKRPSHNLSLDDMNQLLRYRTLAEKYMGGEFTNFKAYLIGRQMEDELRSNLRSMTWLEVKTYTKITAAARKRYKEFLDVLKKKEEHLKSVKEE